MKRVLFAVAIAFIAITTAKPSTEWKPPTREDVLAYTSSCYTAMAHLPDSEIARCIDKCVIEKQGIFNTTHGFNVENVVKLEMQDHFSENAARSMAQKCAVSKKESETDCEWAKRGMDCFREETLANLMKPK